ncbi:MAG: iron-sulfur cluster insertion protein ErpA [Acidimicrobiales bacterium]
MSTTEITESIPTTEATVPEVIGISDAAYQKVSDLLTFEQNPDMALRIAVRPGGCSGYSYEMFFDSELAPDDVQTVRGMVRVVVDPASAQLLNGATLDYKDGLQGAGFSINNPNATRSCGCGQSFS